MRITRASLISLLLASAAALTTRTTADDTRPAESEIERVTKSYFDKYFLRYSPDGSHIAYSRHHRNPRQANKILVGARIMRADGTEDRPLLEDYESSVQIQEHPAFSPDGKFLVVSGGGNDTGNSSKDTFICELDEQFQATGLRRAIDGTSVMLGEEPCFSPDGKRICYVTIDEKLWVVDLDNHQKTQILQVDGTYCHQPAWSPDGKWIAFATDRDGNVELYKVRWDGSELTRLTDSPKFDCRPRWSRDGRWILFTSNRSGNHDLFVMPADGGPPLQLTDHPSMDDHADWSPDGQSISFVSLRDGGFDIYRLPVPEELHIGPPAEIDYESTADAPDLLVHYDFDRLSTDATSAPDRSGRNALELVGARLQAAGERGWLSFDGEDDYAVLGNPLALRTPGPITVSFWVRPAQSAGNGYLVSKHGWNVYLGSDQIPRFETRTAANDAWDTLPAATPIEPQTWTHVTTVFDTDTETLAIYLNGELSARRARTDGAIGATDSHPIQLGQYTAGASQQFAGDLDEIRIYSRALQAEEVLSHFNQEQELVSPP